MCPNRLGKSPLSRSRLSHIQSSLISRRHLPGRDHTKSLHSETPKIHLDSLHLISPLFQAHIALLKSSLLQWYLHKTSVRGNTSHHVRTRRWCPQPCAAQWQHRSQCLDASASTAAYCCQSASSPYSYDSWSVGAFTCACFAAEFESDCKLIFVSFQVSVPLCIHDWLNRLVCSLWTT